MEKLRGPDLIDLPINLIQKKPSGLHLMCTRRESRHQCEEIPEPVGMGIMHKIPMFEPVIHLKLGQGPRRTPRLPTALSYPNIQTGATCRHLQASPKVLGCLSTLNGLTNPLNSNIISTVSGLCLIGLDYLHSSIGRNNRVRRL